MERVSNTVYVCIRTVSSMRQLSVLLNWFMGSFGRGFTIHSMSAQISQEGIKSGLELARVPGVSGTRGIFGQ